MSEIPLKRLNAESFLVHKHMKVGVGGSNLVQCQLGNAENFPTKVEQVRAVLGGGDNSSVVPND